MCDNQKDNLQDESHFQYTEFWHYNKVSLQHTQGNLDSDRKLEHLQKVHLAYNIHISISYSQSDVRFSCRHTTLASNESQPLSQTLLHNPLMHISTLPSFTEPSPLMASSTSLLRLLTSRISVFLHSGSAGVRGICNMLCRQL